MACQECLRKCLVIHRGKHDHSQKVPTFFKIMFGNQISELLYVPPQYSQKLAPLVGRKFTIEDSSGHKWKVVLSDVEGSLAFKKGWNEFFRDQGIESGDFLVFHHIDELHLLVTIYGKSGCEKPVPVELSYQKKRLKTTTKTTTEKDYYNSLCDLLESPPKSSDYNAFAVRQSGTGSIMSQDNVNDVNKSAVVAEKVPKTDFLQEPNFVIEKETTFAKEADRDHLLDLSRFEMPDEQIVAMQADNDYLSEFPDSNMANNNVEVREDHGEHRTDMPPIDLPDMTLSFADKGDENYLSNVSTLKPIDKNVDANFIGELQVQEYTCSEFTGELHKVQPGDASIGNENMTEHSQANTVLPSSKTETNRSKSECIPVPCVSPKVSMPLSSVMPQKSIDKFDTFQPSAAPGHCHPSGGTMGVVKQETKGFGQGLFNKVTDDTRGLELDPTEDDVKVIPFVKPEPVDYIDSDSASTYRITCSIPPDSESFLVLPEPLPLKRGHSMKLRQKLIYLQSPDGKVWPVLYHNTTLHKVLAFGWKSFRKANKIRSGDKCDFVVHNLDKGIFRVETHSSEDLKTS